MNKYASKLILVALFFVFCQPLQAQTFDFDKLQNIINEVTVVIDIKVEYSFGIHSNEQEERYLGTIVSEDGLVTFNGASLSSESSISSLTGMNVKTKPVSIVLKKTDGTEMEAEFIGVDRFTKIGFLKIDPDKYSFRSLKFKSNKKFKVGEWVALYMLLPEFITPSFAADIGMISTLVKSPEEFPLIVGFSTMQMTSVLFDENLDAVGILGVLNDPGQSSIDPSGMLDSFNSFGIPLLGVVTADKIEKMIADPPVKGKSDRGWLGITLQALTPEMAKFWDLDVSGGIIVNDIVNNSPASTAGLEIGDIIFQINGQPVEVDKEEKISLFQRTISDMGPGANVEFAVIRRNKNEVDTISILASLENTPMAATDAPEYENEHLEFSVRDLVFGDYLFFNLDPDSFKGIIVTSLKQGGLANVEGLQVGDVIQRIGSKDVESVDQVEQILQESKDAAVGEIIFFVWRNQKTLFVNVKTDW